MKYFIPCGGGLRYGVLTPLFDTPLDIVILKFCRKLVTGILKIKITIAIVKVVRMLNMKTGITV